MKRICEEKEYIMTKLTTALLAFERSIQIGEAFMFAGKRIDFKAKTPIVVEEKTALGQTANYAASLQNGKANFQTIDSAIIPLGHDKLIIEFNVKVQNNVVNPSLCDDPEVVNSFKQLAKEFDKVGGFNDLAERYIWNIANGRFAWRNRNNAEDATVTIIINKHETITFNCFDVEIRNFNSENVRAAIIQGAEHYDDFVEDFGSAFVNDGYFGFKVIFEGNMNAGDEVWPSQEFITEEKSKKDKFPKSREYAGYKTNGIRHAYIHSQKIGAAIRAIDEWHGNDNYGAVVVHPYAGVKETGEILRGNAGNNFFKMFKDAEKNELVGEEMTDNALFFFANVIRGGVFGKADDKKAEAKNAEKEKKGK